MARSLLCTYDKPSCPCVEIGGHNTDFWTFFLFRPGLLGSQVAMQSAFQGFDEIDSAQGTTGSFVAT